jgi:iduronate 2-sulfatase
VNYLKGTLADGKIQFTDANDARGDKPVFMAVGFKKPHLPFIAPGQYWNYYTDATNLLPTSSATPNNPTPYSYTYWDELRGYDGIPAKDTSTAAPGNQPSDEQKTNIVRGYQACVSYIDKLLGDIMTQLRDTSNSVNINNTVIVLWGDQGFHLGDKGQWCKHTNFDVATRIPMIIRDPRVLGGVRLNNVAEALDIYPTLRQLCHLGDATPSHYLEGKDLSSRLHYRAQDEAAHEPHNMAVTEYIRNNGNVIGYSIKDTRYKYTRWYNNVENHIDDADNRRYYVRDFSVCQYEELYDIYHDVDEVENIFAANQDTTLLRDLRIKFMNMVKNIPGEIHGPNTLLSHYQETQTKEDNSLIINLKAKMT